MLDQIIEFFTNLFGNVTDIIMDEKYIGIYITIITIIAFIIYQRFYSMSCKKNECMQWICLDEDREFRYRVFSGGPIGIFKAILFTINLLLFISIIGSFLIVILFNSEKIQDRNKLIYAIDNRYNLLIAFFIFMTVNILTIWWSRSCGFDDETNEEVPVSLTCNGVNVDFKSKFTKLTGLFIFGILLSIFMTVWYFFEFDYKAIAN